MSILNIPPFVCVWPFWRMFWSPAPVAMRRVTAKSSVPGLRSGLLTVTRRSGRRPSLFCGDQRYPVSPSVATPVRTAEPITPEMPEPLLSAIVVAPDGSFISHCATTAPYAEAAPADAAMTRPMAVTTHQRRTALDESPRSNTPRIRSHLNRHSRASQARPDLTLRSSLDITDSIPDPPLGARRHGRSAPQSSRLDAAASPRPSA